jgi:AcrR family transcriptional regulator
MTSVVRVGPSSAEGARRTEILDTAAELFASSGFRTSLKEIADACGILPGSLYHHFESKEAIIVELVERYQAELDVIAAQALDELRRDTSTPDFDRIAAFAVAIATCRHVADVLRTSGRSKRGIRTVGEADTNDNI